MQVQKRTVCQVQLPLNTDVSVLEGTLHQMSAVAIDFHVGHVQDPVYFEAESD